MEPEQEREVFRQRLLDALTKGTDRSACHAQDPIHVFVNERRVGQLGYAEAERTLQLHHNERIRTVELRSEDGVLLEMLAAPDEGFQRECRSHHGEPVELCIQNTDQSGSVTAIRHPKQSRWHRIQQMLGSYVNVRSGRHPPPFREAGLQALTFTHVVLVVLVVGLVADRLTGWMSLIAPPMAQDQTRGAVPLDDQVTTLSQRLDDLAHLQEESVHAIQSHQQAMAHLQDAMADLSNTQERLAARMLTVGHAIKQGQREMREEVERVTHGLQEEIHTAQTKVADQLRHPLREQMPSSPDSVDGERADPASPTPLTSRSEDRSPPDGLERPRLPIEQRTTAPSLSDAEGQVAAPQPLFVFWVTFSEGTSQDRIDEWIGKLQGHKGAVNEGWQAITITPPAEPIDRFLAQVKEDTIVKSVRVDQ